MILPNQTGYLWLRCVQKVFFFKVTRIWTQLVARNSFEIKIQRSSKGKIVFHLNFHMSEINAILTLNLCVEEGGGGYPRDEMDEIFKQME